MDAPVKNVTPSPKKVLSRSTILILSGTLLGMGIGNGFSADSHVFASAAGVIGLLAYLSLDSLAVRSRKLAECRALEQATSNVEHRMEQLISRSVRTVHGEHSEDDHAQLLSIASGGG